MFKSLTKTRNFRNKVKRNRAGQGITEYGSILAFVALLVAMVFVFAPGRLGPAVSQCFSSAANQLNILASGS